MNYRNLSKIDGYALGLAQMMKTSFGVRRPPQIEDFIGKDDSEERKAANNELRLLSREHGFSQEYIKNICLLLFEKEDVGNLKATGIKHLLRYLQEDIRKAERRIKKENDNAR